MPLSLDGPLIDRDTRDIMESLMSSPTTISLRARRTSFIEWRLGLGSTRRTEARGKAVEGPLLAAGLKGQSAGTRARSLSGFRRTVSGARRTSRRW